MYYNIRPPKIDYETWGCWRFYYNGEGVLYLDTKNVMEELSEWFTKPWKTISPAHQDYVKLYREVINVIAKSPKGIEGYGIHIWMSVENIKTKQITSEFLSTFQVPLDNGTYLSMYFNPRLDRVLFALTDSREKHPYRIGLSFTSPYEADSILPKCTEYGLTGQQKTELEYIYSTRGYDVYVPHTITFYEILPPGYVTIRNIVDTDVLLIGE